MREYKTQMEAARKGIVTEELKKVAQKEHMRVEELMPLEARLSMEALTAMAISSAETDLTMEAGRPPLSAGFMNILILNCSRGNISKSISAVAVQPLEAAVRRSSLAKADPAI